MLRLKRFIKPFLGSIALALVLLFVQALCDLNLPNLMSNIVDVGIQQGGVEDSSPEAVSSDGYELMETFMTSDQKDLLDENYELVLPSDLAPDGKPWSDQYPDASDDGFYVIKQGIDADTRTELDTAFGEATWTMINVLQEYAANGTENLGITMPAGTTGTDVSAPADTPAGTPADTLADTSVSTDTSDSGGSDDTDVTSDIQNIDFTALYEAIPLFQMIPEDTMAVFQETASQTDPLMLDESATMLVRNFYKELGVNMDNYELGYIVRIGLFMLLITVIGGIATVLVGLISSRAGAGLARDLRSAIFKKVLGFSHTEFDRFSTASLITRSTNDVTQIQMVITIGIRMLFYAPIMGVGAVIMALRTSVGMSWIMGIAVIFMAGMMGILFAIVMPKFKIIQKLIDRLNLVARETLNGQMVIRAFSREPFEKGRFEKANADVTKTNLFIQRAMVFMMPIMMIFMNALTILIIWIGSEQVAASQMQVGDMMAYMQYAMMMVMSFMFIAMAFIFVPRAAVSADRIADVLDTEPTITDPQAPVAIPEDLSSSRRGRVELKDVSFQFEGAEVSALEHINFVAESGSTTAIIGSTGSGKSSILNLIPRFYDATEGTVFFDGIDVRDLSIHDLRSRIGYVPQKSLLMSGTVAENIAYGHPAMPSEDVEKAAEVAQALDFIGKLDTLTDEGRADTAPTAEEMERLELGDALKETSVPPEGQVASEGKREGEDGATGENLTIGEGRAQSESFAVGEGLAAEKHTEEIAAASALASGFDFEISQGGSNVSGGQRQRLAIARALAVHPEVFLFDDSFSALDFATDAALRKALADYTQDATLIIVAQRVGTIMDAENIYVLDDGRIIGQGTHAQLLRTCPAYREIAESQLSPEELEASMGGDAQ